MSHRLPNLVARTAHCRLSALFALCVRVYNIYVYFCLLCMSSICLNNYLLPGFGSLEIICFPSK